jgi:hypothetical protein
MIRPILLLSISSILFFSACGDRDHKEKTYNSSASLDQADSLPINPMEWRLITTVMDTRMHRMCALYGNDQAVDHARLGAGPAYPAGSEISLVTWTQQEDKHWFGANIPSEIFSVEWIWFTDSPNHKSRPAYRLYSGKPLRLQQDNNSLTIQQRVNYILDQKASVIP